MVVITNNPDIAGRFYRELVKNATKKGRGIDTMKMVQFMAGVLVETYLLFDEPGEAMETSFTKLKNMLGYEAVTHDLHHYALPPAHVIDCQTERGRTIARVLFEDWLDCEYVFHDLVIDVIHQTLISWEQAGFHRAESFRLLIECTKKALSFEIAAQELCDVVLDRKVADEGWSLGDCIAALSAVAGRRLALSLSTGAQRIFSGCELPDNLDRVVYVMTQEAVRLGVPAGSDWRFGLAANDVPVSAPMSLILGIEPYCNSFFNAINMRDEYDQSVSCAKAAGRMLAVASGGEMPELEPTIAKPLAMAAITETYKSVCIEKALVSL